MITALALARVRFSECGWSTSVMPRDRAEQFGVNYAEGDAWVLEDVEACGCCGRPAIPPMQGQTGPFRCARHVDRNPCAIEGCRRTRAAASGLSGLELADDRFLCAEHWRRYVPPRSRMRRAYARHLSLGKRFGWPHERRARFGRFWDTLVAVARRRATEGRVDEAAIAAMFGWDAVEG